MAHYYTKQGQPQHFQTVASGKNKGNLRPSTVRDAKKHRLVPSVTTILGVLDKGEGLTVWKIEQALAKYKAEQAGEKLIQRDYAAEGTSIHAVIESYIETGKTVQPDYWPFPSAMPKDYINCYKGLKKSLGLTDPVAEESFATEVYGGSVDIHDPEQNIIIDLKTKDGIIDDKKLKTLCTAEYGMQLVAYREGLGMGAATCVSWFVSRTDPHQHNWYIWKEEELERCAKMFELTTDLWYLKTKLGE